MFKRRELLVGNGGVGGDGGVICGCCTFLADKTFTTIHAIKYVPTNNIAYKFWVSKQKLITIEATQTYHCFGCHIRKAIYHLSKYLGNSTRTI